MSRDWSPRELYFADKHMAAQGFALRNSSYTFVNTATGEKIPLKSEEEKIIGKNFYNLSFMLDGWYRVYNSMTNEVVRDKWYPSTKTCHECGGYNEYIKLGDFIWVCPHCGAVVDRDPNAALNIKEEGFRMLLSILNLNAA